MTSPPRRRALLVASTGGHLEELVRLAPRLEPAFDSVEWVTFDDAQSRSLLAGQRVHLVERIPPRGLREAAANIEPAFRIVRRGGFTDVVSTGSAIAVPFLSAARVAGVRAHFVESAARAEGPSMSGRLVSRLPGVLLYTQYRGWESPVWAYRGSVVDRFEVEPHARPVHAPGRVVVTLGTMRGYPFDRAVVAAERVLAEIGAPDREVLWQIGDATAPVTHGRAHDMVPAADLNAAIDDADLVIAHAGVGSSMRILEAGISPVLLYRQAEHGEHVDDHQLMIAKELDVRSLAVARDPVNLVVPDVELAMTRTVHTRETSAPFVLDTRRRLHGSTRVRRRR